MESITLTAQTIAALHKLCGVLRDMYEENGTDSLVGAGIRQGDYTVMADYKATGEVAEDKMVHTEVAGNNTEDLSHLVCTDVEITDVYAFDDDDNEYDITNRQEVFN